MSIKQYHSILDKNKNRYLVYGSDTSTNPILKVNHANASTKTTIDWKNLKLSISTKKMINTYIINKSKLQRRLASISKWGPNL